MSDIMKQEIASINTKDAKKNLVNATVMAAAFNKKPANWLRMKSTKAFIATVAVFLDIQVDDLVLRPKKNNKNGKAAIVWMHEEVALEFARWLSPSFAIWNNRHTLELLLTGRTETSNIIESMPALAVNFQNKGNNFNEMVNEQSRKVLYHDTVLQSRTLITATAIAKELGISAVALNKWLQDKRIIYKSGTQWLLYSEYQDKGYTGTKTALYMDSNGRYQTTIHTYWTEKGREFIHRLFLTKQAA